MQLQLLRPAQFGMHHNIQDFIDVTMDGIKYAVFFVERTGYEIAGCSSSLKLNFKK